MKPGHVWEPWSGGPDGTTDAHARSAVISDEVRRSILAVRSAISADRSLSMWISVPESTGAKGGGWVPSDLLAFFSEADGGIFGQVVIFDAMAANEMQFYADRIEGVPVQLGPEVWFCFGKVGEDPLFIRRSDQSIWGFPDVGVLWWQSQVFEKVSDNLDSFLRHYVFGSGYRRLVGSVESDRWWELLCQTRSDGGTATRPVQL
ncbi:hypothetical protein [Streptomyces liangshanensis]|uniref:hypothetical protein n=1 Tax=Streptomyces liangshanensis TaxID=2717324 RepID=UPI0036D8498D